MQFAYDECRQVLLRGLIDSLTANADSLRSIAGADASGINAVSFDILPWHRFVCLSFRSSADNYVTTDDGFKLDIRYSPADWKYYEFISNGTLDTVRDYTANAYPLSGGKTGQEALHLILLAAADALLDEQVANLLREYGLDATQRNDEIPWGGFEYLVLDEDRAFKANYCEFVLATRVTQRLLGTV